MSVLELNDRQWEAVRATDRHVLVSAGAGTGKTRTVVGRVLYLLGVELRGERHPDPVPLRDIAAITFTNAAAADLKDKLREALRRAGRHDDAYLVDVGRIGTIHAFCAEILREFALRAGVRPATDILEEGEGAAFAAVAVRDALLQQAEERKIEGLTELLADVSVPDIEGWVTTLIDASDRLRAYEANRQRLEPRGRTLAALARAALDLLEERLRARGAVDFDRMIVWTRDLLRDHAGVRRVLQRRVKTLIVDEFQDVDPVQQEIAYLLGEPHAQRGDTTRLMLVGDAKQSIFRFRGADVTVWRAVERDFAERQLGLVVPLEENFRSVPPVLGFLDAVIGPILSEPADGTALKDYEIAYQHLEPHRGDGQKDRAVELIVVPPRPDGKDYAAAEVRRIEATAVARRAKQLHDQEGMAWADMAVLLAGWGGLEIYQSALAGVGAPTYALRTEGFYTRREVIDLIVALETLRDPTDNRALLGFLRSPFVGVRDDTLLAIARQARRPYWDHRRQLSVGEQQLLHWGFGVLERHVPVRDRVPTAELLESLLEETGYLAHLALLGEEGQQAIANVRKFLGMARALADLGVGEFLRVVNEARARNVREADAVLHGQGDEVVTITSVHSAKGLEWKVVFWCDLVRMMPAVDADLLLGRDTLELKAPALDTEEQPQRWQDVREVIQAEEEAQAKRVWYVATTRAMDRLILAGLPAGQQAKPRLDTPAGRIWKVLPQLSIADGATFEYRRMEGEGFTGIVRLADPAVLVAAATEAPAMEIADPLEALPGPVEPITVRAGRPRHSATELLTYARCPTKHWFKYVAGLREPPVDVASESFVDAVTRGIIVHDVLERLAEEAEFDQLLEDAIGRWDPEAPPPDGHEGRAYRTHLREEVERVANHADYRAIADLASARRELGFLHLAEGGEYSQGHFDLVASEEAGLVLLDVKTSQGDQKAASRKAKQYAPQRDVYVTAAEAIGALPVARFAFQFSRAGVHLSEEITGEVRARARAEFARIAQEIGRGKPELTRYPEECRQCGYNRVGWCEGVGGVGEVGGSGKGEEGKKTVQGDLFADRP